MKKISHHLCEEDAPADKGLGEGPGLTHINLVVLHSVHQQKLLVCQPGHMSEREKEKSSIIGQITTERCQ